MKGRILLLKIMPKLNLLQKKQVFGDKTFSTIKELVTKYSNAENLTYDDVITDLLGLDIEEGKENLFSDVLNDITLLGEQSQSKGGIQNE